MWKLEVSQGSGDPPFQHSQERPGWKQAWNHDWEYRNSDKAEFTAHQVFYPTREIVGPVQGVKG